MLPNLKKFKVLVLGLGNELLTDDGVGVHVLRTLQKQPPANGVLFAEIGTAILHSQHLLEQAETVIAIDAVRAGDRRFDLSFRHRPGTNESSGNAS